MVRFSLHELTPSAFPYFLLAALPLAWHRPVTVAVIPVTAVLALLIGLIVTMEGNMGEAYSVWCFSGVTMNLYYLILPYWFQLWPEEESKRSRAWATIEVYSQAKKGK